MVCSGLPPVAAVELAAPNPPNPPAETKIEGRRDKECEQDERVRSRARETERVVCSGLPPVAAVELVAPNPPNPPAERRQSERRDKECEQDAGRESEIESERNRESGLWRLTAGCGG